MKTMKKCRLKIGLMVVFLTLLFQAVFAQLPRFDWNSSLPSGSGTGTIEFRMVSPSNNFDLSMFYDVSNAHETGGNAASYGGGPVAIEPPVGNDYQIYIYNHSTIPFSFNFCQRGTSCNTTLDNTNSCGGVWGAEGVNIPSVNGINVVVSPNASFVLNSGTGIVGSHPEYGQQCFNNNNTDFYVFGRGDMSIFLPTLNCGTQTAPTITASNQSYCIGETTTTTLTASNCNGLLTWDDNSHGNTRTVTPTSTTTYYANCNVDGCISANQSITVAVNALPTLSVSGTTCSTDLKTYTINFTSDGTVTSTAGTVSGNTVTNIPTGTNVTLTATNSANCTTTLGVSAPNCACPTINAPISNGNETICIGSAIAALSVNVGSSETANWFNASGTQVATGTTSYTPVSAGTFYAQAQNTTTGCINATKTAVSLTINALPTLNVSGTTCSADLKTYTINFTSDGTVTSTAGTVSGNTVTNIPTGTNVTLTATNAANCTTTLGVSAPNCACPTINAPISNGNETICIGSAIAALSVNVGSSETANWFNASGTQVATGTTSYTPVSAGTFYAQAQNTTTGCINATKTAVSLTINALPTLNVSGTTCSADLKTYTINFTSDGTVTSTAGTVSGNTVTNIPTGTNVTLTATNAANCTITLGVSAPNCACPTINAPTSNGNETICTGSAIAALSVNVGSGETANWFNASGTQVATGTTSYTPVSAGTFYAQAQNTTTGCISATKTAVSLTVNALPSLSVSGTTCSTDLKTYTINFISDGTVTSTAGTVNGNTVTNIPTGTNVTLTATSAANCTITLEVSAPNCACPNISTPTASVTQPDCSVLTGIITISAPTGYMYSINGTNYQSSGTFSNLSNGTYPVTAKDETSGCISNVTSLVVNAAPKCTPKANSDNGNTNSGTAITLPILTNDVNGDGTPTLDLSKVTLPTATKPTNGTVIINSDGTATYTPNNGFSGTDSFTYTICDKVSPTNCNTATVTVVVSCPSLSSPNASVTAQPSCGNLSGAITVITQSGISYSIDGNTYQASGTFGNLSGGTYQVTAKDVSSNCISAPTQLVINAAPMCTPQATNDNATTYAGKPIMINILTNDKNSDGSAVTDLSKITLPTVINSNNGVAVVNSDGTVTYTPNAGFSGTDVFTYTICDKVSPTNCSTTSVTVIVIPQISIQLPPVVCSGEVVTFTAIGCNYNYNWLVNGSPVFTPTLSIQVSNTTNVHLTCYSPLGNQDVDATYTPIAAQTINVYSTNGTQLVLGQSMKLGSDNCSGTLSWSDGQTGNPITINPKLTTSYTATCSSTCGGTGNITIQVVPPKISIAMPQATCLGNSVTFNPIGCSYAMAWTYKYGNEAAKTVYENYLTIPAYANITVHLTCYTPVGNTDADAIYTPIAAQAINVYSTNGTQLVLGQSMKLGSDNCSGSLSWSDGQSGNPITISPTQSTSYTATCSSTCGGKGNIAIQVVPPKVSIAMPQATCLGNSVTFNPIGCSYAMSWTYKYGNEAAKTVYENYLTIPAYANITVHLTCYTPAGNSDADEIYTPYSMPSTPVIISQNGDSTLINGNSLNLIAKTCDYLTLWESKTQIDSTYKILNPASSTNTLNVTPNRTTQYAVKCISVNGCESYLAYYKVYVRPQKPTLKSTMDTLCVGSSTTINAKGCANGSLRWINLSLKDSTFSVKPLNDTTYSAVCVGYDGLNSDTVSIKISVLAMPTTPVISATNTNILNGEMVTMVANCSVGKVVWIDNITAMSSRNEQPSLTKSYSAYCQNGKCTSANGLITIHVRPKPPVLVIVNSNKNTEKTGLVVSDTICVGKSLTLKLSGKGCVGSSPKWSDGTTNNSITLIGVKDVKYYVSCVDSLGAKSDSSIAEITVQQYSIEDVIVYPNPTQDKIFIHSKGCVDGLRLQLWTLNGENVYEGNGTSFVNDSIELDLFDLPSANYILKIIGEQGVIQETITKRIVKFN